MKNKMKAMLVMFPVLISALAISFLSACTKSNDDDPNKAVIHNYEPDDAKTLDPANAYDSVSLDVTPNIYQPLYQYDYLNDEYKLVPLLAADMPKYSSDFKTVTIQIRQDVKFHDDKCFTATQGKGRTLTAHDFILGFKRLALPSIASSGWWILETKVVGIDAFREKLVKAANKEELAKAFNEPIEGLKALNDFTLQIKLLKPYPQLKYALAMPFTSPIAKEALDAYADEKGNLNEQHVGTGPFTLKKWDHGSRITLVRNPNYFSEFFPTKASPRLEKLGLLSNSGKRLPLADELQFHIIKERQPAWLNFLAQKLSIMLVPKDNFGDVVKNKTELTPEMQTKGIRLNMDPATVFYYIAFNVKDPVLAKNKYLRQAISSSIDRDKWIEIFTNGRGQKQVTALPPGVEGRPQHAKIKYDFDIAKGKELLKKAGYPNGDGLPVLKFDLRGADSLARQMGEFFTTQAAQIGVKFEPVYNTFPAFLEKAKKGNLQVFLGGWGLDYPDPENAYQLLYGPNKAPGPNDTNYDDLEFNKLHEQMAAMEPSPARTAIIQKMDDMLQEEAIWAMGYYISVYYVSQPWITGFRANELFNNKFKYYGIDQAIKKKFKK